MRLLYIIDSLAPGGAETSLAEMSPYLVDLGIELHVLCLGKHNDLSHRLISAGAQVHYPQRSTGRLSNILSIASLIRAHRPDLVHTTLYEANIAGRVAAFMTRTPVSTSLVGDTYGPHRTKDLNPIRLHLAKQVDRFTARVASGFHAVSTSIAESAIAHLRLNPNRITTIPRGRDPERFPKRTSDTQDRARTLLGIPSDGQMLLAVGRLEPQKGLSDFLDAAALLAEDFPKLTVLIAGKAGAHSQHLKTRASQLSVDIRFLGHRTDIPTLLTAADAFVFPSLTEGSPGSLIEAMAIGCPIVASNIPANMEVLGRDASDFAQVSKVGDPDSMAHGLRQILTGSQSPKAPEAARNRFEEAFQIQAVAAQMHNFFMQVVKARSRRQPFRGDT